jgi:site-specific recombinase XerD
MHSAPVRPADAWLISEWTAAVQRDRWTASAAARGAKTLRRLARVSSGGLLGCTRLDIQRFAADKARGLPADTLLASASWHRALGILDSFYSWAGGRFLIPGGSPLAGLRRLPRSGSRSDARTVGAWRRYDQVLNDPKANPRARAVLTLLAHGLTVAEVVRLRTDHIDLGRREIHVIGPGARRRLIPFSSRTLDRLAPWVTRRQAEAREPGWLFTMRRGDRITAGVIGETVRGAAQRVFRRVQQLEIRRRIRPGGFRHVFAGRLIRRGAPIDVFGALLGITELRFRTYRISRPPPERLVRELAHVRRRFACWI